ncbi:MAG: MBL fold metallo-hydrolase [Clostridia bacterium]|nr:MBL fold metallo-hydrolase [Clostridia bacterium]
MNRLATLFSSSSGNCTLICNDDTNILIDAGVSASRITAALREFELDICEIDGIVVTHEHTDHIKAVGALSRKYNIPVYANAPTMTEIIASVGDLHDRNICITQCGKSFDIRSINIVPFSIPHDAVEPMGYTVDLGSSRVSVATDTGHITKSMLVNMSKSDTVLIESNHDVEMVKNGKYPYMLKKRILSDNGHLSNENAAWLATQLALWGTKKIILGHLSEHNNIPEKAYETAEKKLCENNIKPNSDVILKVASKSQPCMV